MHRVQILDGEGMRKALKELVGRASQREAAEQLGVNQSTLSRLLSGRTNKTMAYETYEKICRAFGAEVAPDGSPKGPMEFVPDPSDDDVAKELGLSRFALSTTPNAEIDATRERMIEATRERMFEERGAQAMRNLNLFERFRESVLTEDHLYVWKRYQDWLDEELERLRPRADEVLRELEDRPRRMDQIATFMGKIGRPHPLPDREDKRAWLALFRALEPLSAGIATWGVERTLDELDRAGELRMYLTAALRREEIVLRRERAMRRVRSAKPPMTYREYLEEFMAREAFFEDNPDATEADWQALLDEEEGEGNVEA